MEHQHPVFHATEDTAPMLGLDEIHLVRILPGSEDEPLSCELRRFPTSSCPAYTALSYFWGDPSITETVSLNERQREVTTNLGSFLWHARLPHRATAFFWIDAICIDQDSVEERSRQILRMKDIYEAAALIRAWIGPAADDGDQAMDLLQHVVEGVLRADLPEGFMPDFQTCHPMDQDVWTYLQKLLHRPYWNRVWILQEVSTPSNHNSTLVMCGRRHLPLEHFFLLNEWLLEAWTQTPSSSFGGIFSSGINKVYQWYIKRKQHELKLLAVLPYTRGIDATDPRDKIYALLPALLDGQHEDLRPDYRLSAAQVYSNLAAHLIKRDGNLEVLRFCHLARKVADLPSWVSDWTAEKITMSLSVVALNYNASSTTVAHPKLSADHRRLELRGISFDNIVQALDQNFNNAKWAEFALEGDGPYVTGGTKIEALQHTICADIKLDDAGRAVRGASVTLSNTANGKDWLTTSEAPTILFGVTHGRKLVKTSTGYLGIVSYDTLPGDIVCILYGERLPMILRPVDWHFLLVGESYVHGIMDGEALREVDLEKETRTFEIW